MWVIPSSIRSDYAQASGCSMKDLQPDLDIWGLTAAASATLNGKPSWAELLASHPELAPALEPSFRKLVNGLDFHMDDSRAARLKCVGNGVVPLQAAAAFVVLAKRAGLKRVQAHALESVDVMEIRASKNLAGIDA